MAEHVNSEDGRIAGSPGGDHAGADSSYGEGPKGPPRTGSRAAERAAAVITALLACLALGAALAAVDRAAGLGLFPTGMAIRLAAARRAVLPKEAERRGSDYARAVGPGGEAILVPPRVEFDGRRAVELAVQLDELRLASEGVLMRYLTLARLQAGQAGIRAEADKLSESRRIAAGALAEFLAMEPDRARLCLAALGWPWLGDGPEDLSPESLGRIYPDVPGALGKIGAPQWSAVLADASRPEPWQRTEESLRTRYNLSPAEARAVGAWLVRRDVARAFESRADLRQAQDTLARLAFLAPSQERALLTMAGARELMNTGVPALPVLIDMLEENPQTVLPVVQACVRRAGVSEQAARAAGALVGPTRLNAQRALTALGPLGGEALRDLLKQEATSAQARAEAEALLRRIEADWPGDETGLAALGSDPARWRRWYARARDVL